MKRLLAAAWVAPMSSPPLRDAAVVFDECIIAVGPADQLKRQHPDAAVEDLADSIILPGLINPHTHLELSTCERSDDRPTSFTDWILGIRRQMRLTDENVEQVITSATHTGIEQCLRFGVTTVGDISQQCDITRPVLREAKLRCVSYGEALGLANARLRFETQLARAIDRSRQTPRLRIGLSPHAPYTVDQPGYEQCVRLSREQSLPLATHLAETDGERKFLEHHTGPFRDVWEILGTWSEPVPTYRGGPVHFAREVGLLELPALLAHVNYCDDEELDLLARGRASVVYCPRTHAYFGRPPHRWREMLARGINVAIGTDSCASSPDLNIVDDLSLLHRLHPGVPAAELWQLITTRAATALGMAHETGSLEPGKRADLVVFPAADAANPLESLLEQDLAPTRVLIDGI